MWLHFVSHKFARLLLPYALLTIAITSFWLPQPWNRVALSAQGVFYALALIDAWLPERFPPPRTRVKVPDDLSALEARETGSHCGFQNPPPLGCPPAGPGAPRESSRAI